MNDTTSRSSSGYPLVALFLVLTACGIIAALIGPAVRAISAGDVGSREAIGSILLGSFAVGLVGGVIGTFHYRRARGLAWGLVVGAAMGCFVGPLTLAPARSFGAIVALAFGGAVVVVVLAVTFQLASRR